MRRERQKAEGKSRKLVSSKDEKTGTADAKGKESVAVVGAGRLGSALALALASRGFRVAAVVARRKRHALDAASLLGSQTLALSAAQLSKLPPVKLLFITTPDDAVSATAARLAAIIEDEAETKSTDRTSSLVRSRVVLHASGALSSEALAPLRARGFAVGSMHPLAAVSDAASGAESLRRAFYCVEGDAEAVRLARRLVRALGGRSFTIDTRDKALYHAAAVTASGHAVALFDLASQLLARCGLSDARARRVLLPLLDSTLNNLSTRTPARALTGTFARADVTTVRKHLAALQSLRGGNKGSGRLQAKNEEDAEVAERALAVYALLGRHSLRLAEGGGARRAALGEIARALDEILKSR